MKGVLTTALVLLGTTTLASADTTNNVPCGSNDPYCVVGGSAQGAGVEASNGGHYKSPGLTASGGDGQGARPGTGGGGGRVDYGDVECTYHFSYPTGIYDQNCH